MGKKKRIGHSEKVKLSRNLSEGATYMKSFQTSTKARVRVSEACPGSSKNASD